MKTNYFILLSMYILTCSITFAQPTQPSAPLACNASNCTAPLSEICSGGSTIITTFTGAILRSGSPTSLPALYTYYNITTYSGKQVNATVTIDAQSNVSMAGSDFAIDDDAATDQAGNSIAGFFAPRITASGNLTTTSARGYVQFTIRFYLENSTAGEQYGTSTDDYSIVPPGGGLFQLNYIHYDIDGSSVGSGGWFRETGLIKNVTGSAINTDASSELVSYSYTDGGSWKGFAGSVCERSGVSRCAQVAAVANYSTPQTQVTFRMGYDYKYNGTSYNSQPTRQYGSRFGCFTFPQQATLPVKLLSFTGTYKNNATLLNWITENQANFSGYDIERSTNGIDFSSVGHKLRQGSGSERQQYQHTDNLSSENSNIFYYRLKMIDIDGHFSYSNVIMVRREEIKTSGVSFIPNPVISDQTAMIRFTSATNKTVDLKVVDMMGKVLLTQQNKTFEGTNSISINNLGKLKPGLYVLQMNDGEAVVSTKFSIIR